MNADDPLTPEETHISLPDARRMLTDLLAMGSSLIQSEITSDNDLSTAEHRAYDWHALCHSTLAAVFVSPKWCREYAEWGGRDDMYGSFADEGVDSLYHSVASGIRVLEDALKSLGVSESLIMTSTGRSVFVVHGHDEAAKEKTARLVEQLGLKAVILHEQENRGRTIIEKFEAHSDVAFAVVLLTPDDFGGSKASPKLRHDRARQNVVFELGYFYGRLGRGRVCALLKSEIEKPSDIDGVVYIPMDDHGAWRTAIAKEMRAAGLPVSLDKL